MLVRLVTPDLVLLDAALEGPAALARVLDREVAEGWDVFPGSLRRVRDAIAADPASARWGTRFFVLDEPPTLVGWGGFKGAPRDGAIELGYAIAPAWEGRGLATDAARELVREAFAAPAVRVVLALTLAGPGGSVRVLEKNGFVREGEHVDGALGRVWRWRLDRAGGGDATAAAPFGAPDR
ncbi:MAG: GNAT family N-acetyltransferase [Solirubrobacteraceae bacterium]